jgi:hypothetical protein
MSEKCSPCRISYQSILITRGELKRREGLLGEDLRNPKFLTCFTPHVPVRAF